MKYLNPKNDLTFKKIFGEHPHLLKSLLNGLLPIDDEIESLEYLSPEQVPEIPVFKNTIVDVRCKDVKGRQFIVEMQILWTDSFKYRVLFNASKAYVRQLERGGEYKILQPVYVLSLVDEVFLPEMENYYHHYKIVHLDNSDEQIEGLQFIFVELPKVKPKSMELKRLGVLWLRFMNEINEKTERVPEDLEEIEEVKEALGYLQESAFNPNQLEYYDKYWDAISSERTRIMDSMRKGEAKGEAIGIEKGMEKGMEKEKTTRIIKFLKRGKSTISEIAEDFEVSEGFVKQIKKENNL
ncbi:MAG: putative transposase/invertase (TIGR01784 family) [Arenicella sp.]|jgi:predicted transposase/invertase (TIGR01784 family)